MVLKKLESDLRFTLKRSIGLLFLLPAFQTFPLEVRPPPSSALCDSPIEHPFVLSRSVNSTIGAIRYEAFSPPPLAPVVGTQI